MAYNTPELLLVGAAQNFVLGQAKSELNPNLDEIGTYGNLQLDTNNW